MPRYQYDALQSEYERVSRARDMLESRCRRYKEIQKEWREYEKVWVMKKGPRSAAQIKSADSVPTVERYNIAEDLAPPMPPGDITPTPTHHASESTSPDNETNVLSKARQQHSGGRGDTSSVSVEKIHLALQATRARSTDALANDSTEKSTNGDSRPSTANDPRRSDNCQTSHASNTVSSLTLEEEGVPVIVSERSLKRKRPSLKKEANMEIHVDESVKEELATSSPVIALSSRPIGGIQDSLDLDDVGRSVNTPKKKQRLEQMRLLSSLGDGSRMEFSTQLQGSVTQPNEDAVYDILTTEHEDVMHPKASGTSTIGARSVSFDALGEMIEEENEKRHRHAMSIAGPNGLNVCVQKRRESLLLDGRHSFSTSNITANRHGDNPYGYRLTEHQDPVILRSKKSTVLPRTNSENRRPVPQSRRDRRAPHVSTVAEDGEESTPSKNSRRSTNGVTTLETMQGHIDPGLKAGLSSPHRRLGTLLNDPSPGKAALLHVKPNVALSRSTQSLRTPSALSKGVSVHRAKHDFFITHISNALERPQKTFVKTDRMPPTKTLLDKDPRLGDPLEVLPEHEPLRVRSIDCLRLTDFKLNKNHSEFAFHESIRKHDEKRKVGACTDPFCDRCKEIARFAELTEYVAPPTSRLFGSSPLDAEATEQQLIEEFLGHDKQRLQRMDTGERKEVLKKAREKSFADMYGKHRQLHNRAVSPPGYWETEFPSTQQEAENRDAAKAIDKVRIRERYDEAMRGGLWKFADE